MKITPVKTPKIVKAMFQNYVWDIATPNKTIYLTFDDGPTPQITDWTLQTLKQFNAKATFFCVGNNIENHPNIFQNILKQEHAIGNHTQNHVKGWRTKTTNYVENVLLTESVLKKQILNYNASKVEANHGLSVNLFRPPYGQITPKQGKRLTQLGYKIVMWDVLSFDWDSTISSNQCFQNVISKSKKGSIIVFHDSIKASKHMQFALPKVLEYFTQKGYTFKTL